MTENLKRLTANARMGEDLSDCINGHWNSSIFEQAAEKSRNLGHGEEADQGYHGEITLALGLDDEGDEVYKTATDGDELFTMQPNFGAKMVEYKTRQLTESR